MDWLAMADSWGTTFPSDYIEFMVEYGSGGISESFEVLLPNTPVLDGTSGMGQETANALADWPAANTPTETRQLKPPVIAWGVNIVGDIACWRTGEANPDRWTVVILRNRRRDPWTEYDCSMTEFLRRTFMGEWDKNPFGEDALWNLVPQEFIHRSEEFADFDDENPWASL
ncbi:hypothetical protein AB0D94_25910 [Streptomyces sp. NPDC048255]|uniref:hypothetical protein n=1 Tax=Streptomyces sp. NPDC048255 TaxID=3154713 RepID=UPI0033D2C2C9